MVILASLLVAVSEGLVRTIQVETAQNAEDEISEQALRAVSAIGFDLSRSGWYLAVPGSSDYLNATAAQDRGLVYYPTLSSRIQAVAAMNP